MDINNLEGEGHTQSNTFFSIFANCNFVDFLLSSLVGSAETGLAVCKSPPNPLLANWTHAGDSTCCYAVGKTDWNGKDPAPALHLFLGSLCYMQCELKYRALFGKGRA